MSVSYTFFAWLAVAAFVAVHIFADKLRGFSRDFQSRFFSVGGGVAISYVFLDLLSKLCQGDAVVKESIQGVFPYFEKHVFIFALLGFLLFFMVDKTPRGTRQKEGYWLSIASYAIFNFLVGYSVVDKNDPEVQPLLLFTFAIALHYFVNDFSLVKEHGSRYRKHGKWVLIASLIMGGLVGSWYRLSAVAVSLLGAFIAGGVIMNVTRHELPRDNPNNLGAFLAATAFYAALLLSIGSK